jgi:hypothetical protein
MKPAEKLYPDAPFPVDRLVVANATLGASAHKNKWNPLHLDWDFYIVFEPIRIGEETYNTAMHIEIEARDIRSLRGFVGMTQHDVRKDFNIGSFYLFDHRTSRDTQFRVDSISGNKLNIEAEITVDLGDSYIDPNPPMQKVHVQTEVLFEGILISSYGVQAAADEQKLFSIAQELFDMSTLAPPRHLPDAYNQGTLNLYFDSLPESKI